MEIVAHGLWTAAAAVAAKRTRGIRLRTGWAVWWGVFPDVLAFGPMIGAGLALRLVEGAGAAQSGQLVPRVRLGLPLYPTGHSVLVFLLVFGIACILARRVLFEMLGWLLHIMLDIPTHSYSYYSTRFLWPVSNFSIDGIPWWTPWLWVSTYVALLVVYLLLWKKGWLSRGVSPQEKPVSAPVGRE
ncbi:MAG TPA: hypothetical protein PLA43_06275 [Bryobacteraceae bacterium]|nr:hypothetical protein [Bryobacteraceae bacterium]HOL72032.1 hypothetical protein [Bryobacteraceae bacterium]HOQ45729.1 hypothetical protein [Bryobacteraceae bacterium]HPQ17188.1 hypothetical protein [Bryobacteraceae bacterium]HPU71544.1 hypothetical protein [Bryobacteraceae bacterium]